jgi:hypothetical protein
MIRRLGRSKEQGTPMRSCLVAAMSGLLLTTAAAAQTPAASAVGPRPSYNMQKPSEDIGPFAGGAKVHRTSAKAGKTAKAHKSRHTH